ncbi:collagen binding domain-containing protein [Streptomyces sp. NPDC020883]|uniref:collagen binding domain-containing protein n=1 Tax=Streptomyces sp. NPDC020883 TaxID=3365099 RepID=UPI0037B3D649
MPDSAGNPGASHLGAFGKPGSRFPNALVHGYCADPHLPGYHRGVQYSRITPFHSWASKATGSQVSQTDLMQAAFLLTDTRTPLDNAAAGMDAAISTLLNRGSSYALPFGPRANQRLNYPNVPESARALANSYLQLAERWAGPYRVNIHTPGGAVTAGARVPVRVDVTSATGHKISHLKISLKATGGSVTNRTVTTDNTGTAGTTLTAGKAGAIDIQATAGMLPSTTLYAQIPDDPNTQRVVVTGGHSSATATAHLKATPAHGGLTVVKIAADSHKLMADVAFELRDSHGTTIAQGTTDARGTWQVDGLAPGSYVLHEAKAADGYQLAADRRILVRDFVPELVKVVDTKIAEQPRPRPRPITIHQLPQTGA